MCHKPGPERKEVIRERERALEFGPESTRDDGNEERQDIKERGRRRAEKVEEEQSVKENSMIISIIV